MISDDESDVPRKLLLLSEEILVGSKEEAVALASLAIVSERDGTSDERLGKTLDA